jgi:tripartite-type tricarboxylate transporter receptor subunit TctC
MNMTLLTRRQLSVGLAAATVAMPGIARAQSFPSRPIRFVLPFAAGGVADITSRLAADKLGDKLGQRLVVENQPGPGGIAAARSVTTAAPDGHTLALVTNGTAISVALYKSLPFDPVKDFAPISALGTFDLVFATNADSEFKTLGDFIKAARAKPGALNVGTIAVGSTQNLGAELFKSTANLNFQIVPYRTSPDLTVALLRNDVHLMIEFYAAMKGGLTDGKLRPVGTSGLERASYLPAVPTVAEAAPGYEVTSWNGIAAPAGTPQAIVDRVNALMREILAAPDVKARYAEFGVEAKASSPAEFKTRLEADIKKWSAVIDKAGIPKQ